MAGSIGNMAAIYKKKTFAYVPPSPPADLIEATSYTLDFASRKFILVGIDPTEQLQTVVLLLTSSRYVKISIDFLRRIFSLMGNILSFILNIPQSNKRIIFLETDAYKISSMVYNGSNVLVIESKTEDGCRVLLSRSDLIKLQELEWCITASINEKEEKIKPVIIKQISDYCEYLMEKCLQSDSPPNNLREMEIFIRNVEVIQSKKTPNLGQIKMFATKQLAELCMAHRKVPTEVVYDKNCKSLSSLSPSNACDEINPLEDNDLVEYGYSPISPNYSPGNNIAKSIGERDGSINSLPPHTSDEYELDSQYPPWHHNPDLYLRQQALVVDENDGPTSFNLSPSSPPALLGFTGQKLAKKKKKPSMRSVKRKLF
ncbi:uncharacterized protein LOC132947515 [Metopolophium dirhodum]|uniref:uncharacterized protein LOC132947515 n=1 Tax=Metopolophium dirhodum TaxID=44670 RepID=UPI00299060DA|nr:uncharacterized protein LOC132947515 [Metopolophium dirhodum]